MLSWQAMGGGWKAGRYRVQPVEPSGSVARLLVPDLPCMPSAAMVQSAHNVYHRQTPAVAGHLPTFGAVFDWEGVLPPVRRQRPWVIPALLGLGAATLLLLVDSSRVLLGVAD